MDLKKGVVALGLGLGLLYGTYKGIDKDSALVNVDLNSNSVVYNQNTGFYGLFEKLHEYALKEYTLQPGDTLWRVQKDIEGIDNKEELIYLLKMVNEAIYGKGCLKVPQAGQTIFLLTKRDDLEGKIAKLN